MIGQELNNKEEILQTPEEIITGEIINSALVFAAITEAVHRYYFDNVLLKTRDKGAVKYASDLLTKLWCLNPSWRLVLRNKADRYMEADTTSLEVSDKPKKEMNLTVVFNL